MRVTLTLLLGVALWPACSRDAATDGTPDGTGGNGAVDMRSGAGGGGDGGAKDTCHDGVFDGDETDYDCGGSCTPCGEGHQCRKGSDCASGNCDLLECAPPPSLHFAPPSGPGISALRSSTLAEGDVNGDGIVDLVVTSSGQANSEVVVLLGDGKGSFAVQPGLFLSTDTVAVGDFDGDGDGDLAIAAWASGPQLVLNQGGGRFAAPVQLDAVRARTLLAEDMDRDGHLDLVASGTEARDYLRILYGKGDGTFPRILPVSPLHSALVVDLDRDGWNDLYYYGELLRSDRRGGFLAGAAFPLPAFECGATLETISFGDFNGDGNLDAVGVCGESPLLAVSVSDGAAFRGEPALKLAATGRQTRLADLDGDGIDDAVIGAVDSIDIWLGARLGQPTHHQVIPLSSQLNGFVTSDFNRDGRGDIAALTVGGLVILLQQ